MPRSMHFAQGLSSNNWRPYWNSIPTQSFHFDMRSWDRNLESEEKVQEFVNFVDESLEQLKSTGKIIKIETLNFHLGVAFNSANDLRPHLNRWMRLLANDYIKELHIASAIFPKYNLPKIIPSLLSTLKIEGFRLLDYALKDDFNFPCLEKLSLSRVELSGLVAEKLLSSCLMLKQLDMEFCKGLEDISIPNLPKLSSVKIKFFCKTLTIQASNLQVLHCHLLSDTGFNLDSFSCENLKELSLNIRNISGERIIRRLFTTKLDSLETLHFSYNSGPPTFEIKSSRLKILTLHVTEAIHEVKVKAPKLQSYSYGGLSGLPYSCDIDASNLQTARCFAVVRGTNIDKTWFLKLREYLTMFKHQVLTLRMTPDTVSFDPKPWTSTTSPIVSNLDYLELDDRSSSDDYRRALLNGLLWYARPRILSTRFTRDFLQFLCETFCRCNCKMLCWCRLLKDVKIKTGTYDRPKDLHIVEGKSVYESLPVLEENERVMFELIW